MFLLIYKYKIYTHIFKDKIHRDILTRLPQLGDGAIEQWVGHAGLACS